MEVRGGKYEVKVSGCAGVREYYAGLTAGAMPYRYAAVPAARSLRSGLWLCLVIVPRAYALGYGAAVPQLINSGSIRARGDIITSPEQEPSVSCNELLAWTSSLTSQYCTNSKYGRK